jgi:hypothetical protein
MILLGTFFTITSGDIASATGYTGALVSDLWGLIAIFVGIAILGALWNVFIHRK